MKLPSDVIKKTGPKPGPAVAVFAGVHGNERAGQLALEALAETLSPIAGTVFLVKANPPAIERNVRLVNANLNRLFSRRATPPPTYEGARATELMDLLDRCDALLDLHSYPETAAPDAAEPFAICEPDCRPLVAGFDVGTVVGGFAAFEDGGSDGYMHGNGKIGVCVELGAIERTEKFVDLGIDTARRFLSHFGCLPPAPPLLPRPQRHLRLTAFHKKTAPDFRLARPFRNLEPICAGEEIAAENGRRLVAERDGFIIFPNDTRPVGVEAFLLAAEAT